MVTPPTPRSRRSPSGGGVGSSRRRQSSSSSNSGVMIAIIAGAAALVLILIWQLGGNDPAKKNGDSRKQPAAEAVADKSPKQAVDAVKTSRSGDDVVLVPPERPAPEIRESHMRQAEACFDEASKLDIAARKAQKTGDNEAFNRLINDAWDKLEGAFEVLKPYDLWLDEAIIYDWILPPSYVAFGRRIEKLERLQGRIKRIRPMRREKKN